MSEPLTLQVGPPLPDCPDCLGDPAWEAEHTGYPCACRAEEIGRRVYLRHTYRPDPERMAAGLRVLLEGGAQPEDLAEIAA